MSVHALGYWLLAKVIDGAQGADIADVFADKYNTLYNSVSYCTAEMDELKRDVNNSITSDAMGSNIGVRGVSEMKW